MLEYFFSVAGVGLFFGKRQLQISMAPPIVMLILGLGLISLKYI